MTATRPVPRPATIGPALSEASQMRQPRPRRGVFARVLQSAEPSPDTPAGWANEMLNPVRAGAQARELVGDAVRSARRGNVGKAVGMGALAAMSVPGVPGPDDAARVARALPPNAPTLKPAIRTPDGKVHTGTSHADILFRGVPYDNAIDGFVTGEGKFLDRNEAGRYAEQFGVGSGGVLTSENLGAGRVGMDDLPEYSLDPRSRYERSKQGLVNAGYPQRIIDLALSESFPQFHPKGPR